MVPETPQKQANNKRAGRGGVIPPEAHRFRKGESGNPGGRPKGRTLMADVREALSGPRRAKVVKAFVAAMEAGSFSHLKEYVEREEGKVPDRTVGAPGVTVNVTQISEDDLVRIATRGGNRATQAAAGADQPDGVR